MIAKPSVPRPLNVTKVDHWEEPRSLLHNFTTAQLLPNTDISMGYLWLDVNDIVFCLEGICNACVVIGALHSRMSHGMQNTASAVLLPLPC